MPTPARSSACGAAFGNRAAGSATDTAARSAPRVGAPAAPTEWRPRRPGPQQIRTVHGVKSRTTGSCRRDRKQPPESGLHGRGEISEAGLHPPKRVRSIYGGRRRVFAGRAAAVHVRPRTTATRTSSSSIRATLEILSTSARRDTSRSVPRTSTTSPPIRRGTSTRRRWVKGRRAQKSC